MTPRTQAQSRRHEFDWLRVLTILGVFLYHSLRFFDPEDWHLKNAILHPGLAPFMKFFELWGMPLLFTISGAAVYYSLGRRTARKFLRARAARLLVPLAAGIFSHSLWQVYLERSSHGLFAGSFIEFIPQYFKGLYGLGGNFAWMGVHLWYLEVLFVFSLALLPIFVWLRKGKAQGFLSSLTNAICFPGGIYLLAAPIMLISLLDPGTILTARAFGGSSIAAFLLFFLNGFLVVSNERLYRSVQATRWISLGLGMAATAVIGTAYIRFGEPVFGTVYYRVLIPACGLCSWLWILTLLGFAAGRLSSPSRFLVYANEAALPIYILHQPVLLALGILVIPSSIPIAMKWALIAAAAFAASAGTYELVIRRRGAARFLFGLPAEGESGGARIPDVAPPLRVESQPRSL